MTVLVATPQHRTTDVRLARRADELYRSLTYPNVERAVFLNDFHRMPGDAVYLPHAMARNELVLQHLQPHHDYLLWVDADLVDYPEDLIEQLLAVSATAVVAPFVFVEKRQVETDISAWNGGWFYDTGGFVFQGQLSSPQPPHIDSPERVIEMDSVGCCYLVPACFYRQNCFYRPVGNEVEHRSFMRSVRALNGRILAVRDVEVQHAYLPLYGRFWS